MKSDLITFFFYIFYNEKILIVDASASDSWVMANLLVKAGYDPDVTEGIEVGKAEAAKQPPGGVIVTAFAAE